MSETPFGEGPWRVTDVYSVGPAGEQWACLRDTTGGIVARLPWAQAVELRRMLATSEPEAARSTVGSDHPADTIKMLRETLCVAQSAVNRATYDSHRKATHVARLQRLIDDCDRQRPLGPDGNHDERHTATCGCEERPGDKQVIQ